MEETQRKEKGFRDLKKACKKVLSQEEIDTVDKFCFNYVLRRLSTSDEKHPLSNAYMISLYKVLSKDKFDEVQFEWTNDLLERYKDQIFSPSLLETIVNYHNLIKGVEIKVEPDGSGARITMENGCMYSNFCDSTGNRTCIRGKAIEALLSFNGAEPFFCVLDRPTHSYACIIRAKPSIEAGDLLNEYKENNKTVTVL